MKKKFNNQISSKPKFELNRYKIPDSYLKEYKEQGINDKTAQTVLFYLTQFGGFKRDKLPKYLDENQEIKKWIKIKRSNDLKSTCVVPNDDFIERFSHIKIKLLSNKLRKSECKEREMLENNFSFKEYEKSKAFLENLNNFYFNNVRLDFSKELNSGICAEDRILLNRFHSIPHLNKRPRAGGRLYHPEHNYQKLPTRIRKYMTINSEDCCEFDLSAANLQFLHIANWRFKNSQYPEFNNLNEFEKSIREDSENSYNQYLNMLEYDDPYEYFLEKINNNSISKNKEKMTRDDFKNLVYTLAYTTSKSNHKKMYSALEKAVIKCIEEDDFFTWDRITANDDHDRMDKDLYEKIDPEYSRGTVSNLSTQEKLRVLNFDSCLMLPDKTLKLLKNEMEDFYKYFKKFGKNTILSRKRNISMKLKNMGYNIRFKDIQEHIQPIINIVDKFYFSMHMPHTLLFQEESRFAQSVLEQGCLEKRIPILPIHDSFIAPKKYENEIPKILDDVANNMYGRVLKYKQKF